MGIQSRRGQAAIRQGVGYLVAGMLGLSVLSFSAQAHTDLTVVNWGGDAARAQMLALVRPFEQTTGKSVNMDHYSGDLQAIRDQVDAANVKWDVLDLEYSDLIRLCTEGYLEPIDHSYLSVGADAEHRGHQCQFERRCARGSEPQTHRIRTADNCH